MNVRRGYGEEGVSICRNVEEKPSLKKGNTTTVKPRYYNMRQY
jgi:hypothetical protein